MLWTSTVARLALGAVWAWAAIAKIADPDRAAIAVRAYRILPEVLVKPVAWGLPFLEIAIAVLLILGLRTRLAAILSLAVLAVFAVGVGSAWARGLSIECGCFGGGGVAAGVDWTSYATEIARDVGLMLLSAWLVWRPGSRLSMAER
jgi:uncharacterized membrane protein YphA (DoxX/SURF4 family)